MTRFTEAELLAFTRETLGLRKIDHESAMGTVRGWDSIRHLQLITALETKYGLQEIPADLIGTLTSVRALIEYFRKLGMLQS